MKCNVCGGECEVVNNHWQCKYCDNDSIREFSPAKKELYELAEIDSLFDSFKISKSQ